MMTESQLLKRDSKRNLGQELLQAVRELHSGQGTRKTTFKALSDGTVQRSVTDGVGKIISKEKLQGAKWQLLSARMQSGMSQSQFAKATGVSVRTLQEWEQGRKEPSGAAQSLLKLVSRHPHLLAELA